MIQQVDLNRYHKICRMIEDDMHEAYQTCSEKYGSEAAGLVLVALLRKNLNREPDQWPPPESLIGEVNHLLQTLGLLKP